MGIFAATIGLSAFLLFWIEPLVGQLVLPVFGGTPAVWATVLVFFQGVLLLGYLYGHASVTVLGPRRGAAVHVVLAVLAIGWLVILPTHAAELRTNDLPAALDVLLILGVAVGPPVFVLTATTPLLSAWFAATRPAGARRDPYWLYALSNAGSLTALLAYPFVIGPLVGLSQQLAAWGVVFAVVVGALTAVALVVRRATRATAVSAGISSTVEPTAEPSAEPAAEPAPDPTADPPIDWGRRARWILLAAVPSGLLAAVTAFIAADLIAAPLLWIGPLALYLGSFIVAFSARGRRLVPAAVALAPAVVTLLWIPIGSTGGWPLLPLIVLEWGGLAIVATALHGRLAQDRPPPGRLTEFYLVQSAGGVIGGAFVAILSPLVFPGVWEYPILLVGALGALAVTRRGGPPQTERPARARRGFDMAPFFAGAWVRLIPFAVVAAIVLGVMATDHSIALAVAARWFAVGGLILLVGAQPRFLAIATGLALVVAVLVIPSPALLRGRSFFGVTEVLQTTDGRWTQLMNGTTVHGVQSTDPTLRDQPTSYYARTGPVGDVFSILDASRPEAAIGIVGLGAGGIAAYEQPGQTMTYYEIDPLVIHVATDPSYFTFISEAPVRPTIVLGDARLSLRTAAPASYDLLVLDAFSSDAIPTHLLTVEAMAEDRRVLRPGGVLVIHVSNRYYDLAPAVGAAGRRLGLTVLERRYGPTAEEAAAGAAASIWVVASADQATLDRYRAAGWSATDGDVEPLTDDHPDVLRFLDLGG